MKKLQKSYHTKISVIESLHHTKNDKVNLPISDKKKTSMSQN